MMEFDWKMKPMSDRRAKEILMGIFDGLKGIDPEEMTTFELSVLRRCATSAPPNLPTRGIEWKLSE